MVDDNKSSEVCDIQTMVEHMSHSLYNISLISWHMF